MGCPLAELAIALIMLCTGATNAMFNKIMYQTQGYTIDGILANYDKPWFSTLVMFIGEVFCMVMYVSCVIYYKIKKPTEEEKKKKESALEGSQEDEEEDSEEKKRKEEQKFQPQKVQLTFVTREEAESNPTGGLNWKYPFCVIAFSCFDLLSFTFSGIGLVYCNASVIQILRGFVIVFTMLFSWAFLHRKPTLYQVSGILVAIFGLFMVGGSAVGAEATSSHEGTIFPAKALIGIGITLLGQVFSALQLVLEEKVLKGVIKPVHPLFLVGSEGISGTILMICVAFPIIKRIKGSDRGSLEDWRNALYMTFHIKQVEIITLVSIVTIAIFNWASNMYTKYVSATTRSLVDALRTIVVWVTMAIVYYVSDHQYGEGLTYWSFMEAIGFFLMLLGTSIHNNINEIGFWFINKFCCCFVDLDDAFHKDETTPVHAEV